MKKIFKRDDDFGRHDPEEKEYDALNDETFNQAISDDWEGMKEKKKIQLEFEEIINLIFICLLFQTVTKHLFDMKINRL